MKRETYYLTMANIYGNYIEISNGFVYEQRKSQVNIKADRDPSTLSGQKSDS